MLLVYIGTKLKDAGRFSLWLALCLCIRQIFQFRVQRRKKATDLREKLKKIVAFASVKKHRFTFQGSADLLGSITH